MVAQSNNFNYTDAVAGQSNGNNIYRHIHASEFTLNASVDINHNFFGCNFSDPEKMEHIRGIELVGSATMGGGSSIRVDWNNFNFSIAQLSLIPSVEVLLSGEFPSSTSTIVEFNNFSLDQPTVNLDNQLLGIYLINGNKNQIQIYSNNFNSDAWGPKSPPASDYGIYLAGSIGGGNVLTGNTFEDNPNTAYSVDFYSGIYSQDFTNTVFCENNLRECAYPMYFQGTSMGTQYFANTHTGGSHSFRVENGFIGEQGIEGGEHHGNEWYDKWINIIPSLHAYCWPPSQAPNSRIFTHTAQSLRDLNGGYTYFSEFHPADIDPDQMDEWFKPDLNGFPGTGDCIDHIISSSETDRIIAAGTINLTGLSQAHGWTAKRYLYAKLLQNPGLQGDFSEFGPFLSTESLTSVGQLYAVEQKIAEGLKVPTVLASQLDLIQSEEYLALNSVLKADSVLDTSMDTATLATALNGKYLALVELRRLDSLYCEINSVYKVAMMLKLQEALALNNAVLATNNYEHYEKTVNDISIRQVLFQNGELMAEQVVALGSIAAECPKVGGHGVYRARGLLTGCNEGTWSDDYTTCYQVAPPIQEQVLDNGMGQRSDKKQLTTHAFAYPNPATNGIFVSAMHNQNGQISLLDMTGKVWQEVPFTTADEVKYLDLTNVPSGVYTCIVNGSNGERQVIKIFVIKP